jgi:hypothetical protein
MVSARRILAAIRPTIREHLQDCHVIPPRAECTAAAHKKFVPLLDLEQSRLERSAGLPVMYGCHSPRLRAGAVLRAMLAIDRTSPDQ